MTLHLPNGVVDTKLMRQQRYPMASGGFFGHSKTAWLPGVACAQATTAHSDQADRRGAYG